MLQGLPASLGATASSSRGASIAVLELSRAFEDFTTGGFLGVINNIPGAVRGIGMAAGLASPQVAALEAGISVLATVSYAAWKNWGSLMDALGSGKLKSEAEEMQELHKATKRTADEEERYQKLKERAKHVEAQGKEPEAASDFKAAVDKAVSEGPLADISRGIDKYFGDRIRGMADQDPRVTQARGGLAKAAAYYESYKNSSVSPDNTYYKNARKLFEEAEGAAVDASNAAYGEARQRFLADLGGKPDTAKAVAKAAMASPADFGPGGAAFGQSIFDATPEGKVAIEKGAAEVDAIAAKAEESGKKATANLKEIRDRQLAEDDQAFRESSESGREAHENLQRIRRAGKEANDEKTKAIREQVQRVGPGFDDALEAAIRRRVAGGQAIEAASGALRGQVLNRLGSRDVPAALQGAVADEIVRRAREAVANQLQEAGGNPRKAAAAAVIHGQAGDARKFAGAFEARGATDAQAEHAGQLTAGLVGQGVDARAAMQATYQAMTGNIQAVSGTLRAMIQQQEGLIQLLGASTGEISGLQARVGMQNAKIGQVGANMARSAFQGRSGMMTFGP